MEKILCYSCNKSKNKLEVRKSGLLPVNLLICETCHASKLEPRWVVILAGRSHGPEHVKEVVLKRRYLGNEISASELLI
jgi:NMD protein affecting ribosome stability and mRNA decay